VEQTLLSYLRSILQLESYRTSTSAEPFGRTVSATATSSPWESITIKVRRGRCYLWGCRRVGKSERLRMVRFLRTVKSRYVADRGLPLRSIRSSGYWPNFCLAGTPTRFSLHCGSAWLIGAQGSCGTILRRQATLREHMLMPRYPTPGLRIRTRPYKSRHGADLHVHLSRHTCTLPSLASCLPTPRYLL
jgi:hypothetical protein